MIRRNIVLSAAAAAAAAASSWLVCERAWATTRSVSANGNITWNTAPWSPSGVPVAGDVADIAPNLIGPVSVTFDGLYSTPLDTLNLDGLFGLAASFQQSGSQMYCINENIGIIGPASYTQTDGLNLGVNLNLTTGAQGTGAYTLSNNGTLAMSNENIGEFGNATFTQTGGQHTVNGGGGYNGLYLGYNAGGFGTYTLSGSGSLTVNGYESVGTYGWGRFVQTAGTHTINGTAGLFIGGGSGGGGTFTLSGGTLSLNNATEYVGYSEIGVFNQTNGAHSAGAISIGSGPGGVGTFTLNGGTLTSGFDNIGSNGGSGTLVQNGGSHSAGAMLVGGAGEYVLNGGTLLVGNPTVGGSGSGGGIGPIGQIGQIGQTNSISGLSGSSLSLRGGSGPILLGGGPPPEALGDVSGSANFVQQGGTHIIGSFSNNFFSLTLGFGVSNQAYSASYSLYNGSLVAANVLVGEEGSGYFYQSGGTFNVPGTLWISCIPGSSFGWFTLAGGALSAGIVRLDPGCLLNQSGGTLQYTTFNMVGGTITGTLQNQGTFNYSTNGTFTGRLLNQGVLNPGSNFIAGNGMENDAPLTIYQGQSITLNGAGLDNAGNLTLAGGTLTLSATAVNLNRGNFNLWGAAPLSLGSAALLNSGAFNLNGSLLNGSGGVTNGAGGLFVGPGTITTPFANAGGTLGVQNGAMVITRPFASSGYIQLGGLPASLNGGAITNTGTIQGLGTIGNDIANAGTIEASGGAASIDSTLALGGNVQNLAGGIIRAGTFNKVLVTGGLAVNGGTINLLGGTFDNNGHPLINAGEISGFGTLATSGLTNAAGNTMTFTGGLAAINGPVTNNSGATIRVSYNPALFTGPVVNNGTIKTQATTVTFASTFTGAGTYNSDPATNIFQGDVNILAGGQIVGGGGDEFRIGGTYRNAGSYLNSGGTLVAHDVVNDGSFSQIAGQATIDALSGSGSTFVGASGAVGGGGGTAQVSVASLSQSSVTINSGGAVVIRPAALRVTNSVSNLQIRPSGMLDLGNHALLVDNAATPEASIRQYLSSAYNADASGIGNWLGSGGITSSDAIRSHNGPLADFRISVGYVNGAYANDPLIGGSIPGQETLATNRILVRPALYGDLNLDGKVDDMDLAIFSGLGQYNQPNAKFGWLGGDLNHDGKVDDTDLLIFSGAGNYNGPSYGAAAAEASHASATPSATPSLTGHVEANGDIILSASTSQGAAGDGVLDFVYDPQTGHLTLSYDGDPRVTAAQPFQVVRFKSAGGHFVPGNFNQTDFGAGVTDTTSALNGTASGSNSVPDGYDMGAVLPTGLTVSDLTSDLTLQWNVFGGGLTLKNGDVVVPEPAELALLGMAGVGLCGRRRRRPHGARRRLRALRFSIAGSASGAYEICPL